MANALPQNNRVPSLVLDVIKRDLETNSQEEAGRFGFRKVVKVFMDAADCLVNTAGGRNAGSCLIAVAVYSQSDCQWWPFTFAAIAVTSCAVQLASYSKKHVNNALMLQSNIEALGRWALSDSYRSMGRVVLEEPWVPFLSEESYESLREDIERYHLATLLKIASSADQAIVNNMKARSKKLFDFAGMVIGGHDLCPKAVEVGLSVANTSLYVIQKQALKDKNTANIEDRRRGVEKFSLENEAVVNEARAALELAGNARGNSVVENEEVGAQPGGRSDLNQPQDGVRLRRTNQASNGDSPS